MSLKIALTQKPFGEKALYTDVAETLEEILKALENG